MAAHPSEARTDSEQRIAQLERELAEAREQQAATAEVLRVIASSPTDVQTVLDTVVASAARLCGADNAGIHRVDGERVVPVAHTLPEALNTGMPYGRRSATARAIMDRSTVHTYEPEAEHRAMYPDSRLHELGHQAQVITPLLRQGEAIGTLSVYRKERRPFTAEQITLLETFADQAVIAIENARLFQELQDRNHELSESLEQQTAMSEILRVIAGSPTDLQAVLDAVAESAARVCGSDDALLHRIDGDGMRAVAVFGPRKPTSFPAPFPPNRGSPPGRAIVDRRTVHVHDMLAESEAEYPLGREWQRVAGHRTMLSTPLLREGVPIGALSIRRWEVRPFTDKQIKLVETFADQAVVAIENTRLFGELQDSNRALTEALEQQTATGEILRVIASSPTDLQSVLETIATSAARLCDADMVGVLRRDGEVLRVAAGHGEAMRGVGMEVPLDRASVAGRAAVDRRAVHIHDLAAESEEEFAHGHVLRRRAGNRTTLAAPLLREDGIVGVVMLGRTEVRPFSDEQIALAQTFADQAVIAIENTRLFRELEERNRALSEGFERERATSEILRVIASSPADLGPVLDAVVETAARLCEASGGIIYRVERDGLRRVAECGSAVGTEYRAPFPPLGATVPIERGFAGGRAVVDGQVIHVHDLLDAPDFPTGRAMAERGGHRTTLAVPLMREGSAIGALVLTHMEVRPFTERQIEMVESFADQAVIAIENTRLFQELEDRNRELTEALEQQTATGEILRVIAASPTDLQSVLETVAENAARLCDAGDAIIFRRDGDVARPAASYGRMPVSAREGLPIRRSIASTRAMIECRTIHVHDLAAELDTEYPDARELQRRDDSRTILATPLLREGAAIGSILIRRTEVRPFTDSQIALLETFADQAVIAIENTRLFQELDERNRDLQESNRQVTEALEQQTATSEILGVIASSPTDLQTILDAVAENAARVCGANDAVVARIEGDVTRVVAGYGPLPKQAVGEVGPPLVREGVPGRAMLDRETIHVHDIFSEAGDEYPSSRERYQAIGLRTLLATPLLREGVPIGAILIRRAQVEPFTDKQIQVLETFADQAVIAIENARLFGELQERTRELARSVEELQALSEVGQAVSSSLDLQQVLETIVARAVELSGADGGAVYELDEASGEFRLRATHRMSAELIDVIRRTRLPLEAANVVGQAALTRSPVQSPDIVEQPPDAGLEPNPIMEVLRQSGFRAVLAVPLVREDRVIGALAIRRRAPGAFDQATVDLVQTFANQSVLAIENARLFQEIEEKSRQLAIASQHKSQFLANMSHELRTPLNAILGYTELILDSIYGDPPEPIRDVLERVQQNGRHLLGLINDVLDLARIEAGRLTLALDEYSIEQVVQTVSTATGSLAAEKGLALTTAIQPDLPVGRGDERRLTQVLLNLVGNAIKFTEAGSVGVEASAADGQFTVSVRDTGPGIAEAEHEKIFEEFQQADSSSTRAKGGTGLGLAITRRIVALHGGRLWVESRPGEGSTFSFTLPVRVERQAEIA